jgi:hypothetical protein
VSTLVAAATIAVPLAAAGRAAAVHAPAVAAGWAAGVTAAAPDHVLVSPVVTADLAGVTVEAAEPDHHTLAGLPEWFAAARAGAPPSAPAAAGTVDGWSDDVRRLLFGPDHRYGITAAERAEAALDRAGRSGAAVVLGSVPPVLARSWDPVVTASGLPPHGPDVSAQSPVEQVRPLGDGSAWYLLGTPGVPLAAAGKPAVHVMWALLGGREGRLDNRLRVDRALTYSVAAFSREFAEGGYGMCLARCARTALPEVAAEVTAVLADLAAGRIGDDELAAARERLAVAHLLATTTARGVTERRCGTAIAAADGSGYVDAVRAVSAGDVACAARRIGLHTLATR